MMYSSSRHLKARSVFPILSILCVTSINYETLECFRERSWSSGRCSHEPQNSWMDRLAGDQGLHLLRPPCKTGSGRYTDGVTWETAAQAGRKELLRREPEDSKRLRPAYSRVETGCLRGGNGCSRVKKDVSGLPCLVSSCLPIYPSF